MTLLFFLLSFYRFLNDVPQVKIDDKVCTFAEQRLIEIQTDWSHDKFFTDKKEAGIWYEVLAKNFNNPISVLNAWENSPTHNKILLSDMENICIKESNGYWVLEGWKP